MDMDTLKAECLACTRCELCATRTNVVFGQGVPDAEVLFVGEGPGQSEDEQGLPFVGRSGQLLDKYLFAIDLDRSKNCYIANIVKCRPPQNRDPLPAESEACMPWLEINSYQNLDDIQPENFDLIICTQTLPNVRMIAYDIASISYGIFASPDFLAQNKRITVPAQLEKLPLIHSKSEKVLLQGPLQSITITVEPQIRINSDEAMISAAVEGLGIALRIPLWAAESLTKSGSLIQILGE